LLLAVLAVALFAAACGDAAETTTTSPPANTQPVAGAEARTAALVAEMAELLGDDWDIAVAESASFNPADSALGPCLTEGVAPGTLELATDAAYDVVITAPATGVLGGPSALLEIRTYDSPADAANTFAALEEVFGTRAGRACLADGMASGLAAGLSEDEEVVLTSTEIVVPGAARFTTGVAVEDVVTTVVLDFVAVLDGDTTVVAQFVGFDQPFDPGLGEAILAAAR
jgi:hypothetical protein